MTRKFYNPFKPHIVEFDSGTFAVRKLGRIGWYYYDNQKVKKDDYWWTPMAGDNASRYYVVDSLDMAKTLLEMLQLRKVISSNKVRKIYP